MADGVTTNYTPVQLFGNDFPHPVTKGVEETIRAMTTTAVIATTTTPTTTTTTTTIAPVIVDPISDEVKLYFQLVLFGMVGQAIAVYGMLTNVVNVILFVRMGVVNDPMNISLLALSVSDLCSCVAVFWLNLCVTPGFWDNEDFPFTPNGVHYLFGFVPRYAFVKVTSCITTFIAFERCLCVTFPMKIKGMITPKRVSVITVSIYVFVLGSVSPYYYINRMGWRYSAERNRSVYTLYAGGIYREELYTFVSMLNGTIIPILSFLIISMSTIVLVRYLKKSSKWRSGNAAGGGTGRSSVGKGGGGNTTATSGGENNDARQVSSSKDMKAARMVVTISALFIGCFTPVVVSSVATMTIPAFRYGGGYPNLIYVIYGFNLMFESVNASLNLNFYYRMSTNYRTAFDRLVGRTTCKSRNGGDSNK